mmetsp:Transcript_19316/g.29623  ORF Transcript_19316/g.29623 Transcript_19316/m.29623 type:complete len:130 (+) Transcript_19316:157-546(+)
MDYMPLSLSEFFSYAHEVPYCETQVKKLLYNFLTAVNYLHSANLMHRDLKPANILLDEELNVRICDLGLARTIPKIENPEAGSVRRRRLSKHVCTRFYRPPEVILCQNSYNQAVDLWGAGCILGEMIVN